MSDQIPTAKKANPQANPPEKHCRAGITTLEAEILMLSAVETDRLVYELYGLTEEEIQIVEESVG